MKYAVEKSSCVLEPHVHDLPSNRSLSLLVRLYLLRPRRRMVALVCFRATCSRYLFIPQSVPNSSDCTFYAPGEGWGPWCVLRPHAHGISLYRSLALTRQTVPFTPPAKDGGPSVF